MTTVNLREGSTSHRAIVTVVGSPSAGSPPALFSSDGSPLHSTDVASSTRNFALHSPQDSQTVAVGSGPQFDGIFTSRKEPDNSACNYLFMSPVAAAGSDVLYAPALVTRPWRPGQKTRPELTIEVCKAWDPDRMEDEESYAWKWILQEESCLQEAASRGEKDEQISLQQTPMTLSVLQKMLILKSQIKSNLLENLDLEVVVIDQNDMEKIYDRTTADVTVTSIIADEHSVIVRAKPKSDEGDTLEPERSVVLFTIADDPASVSAVRTLLVRPREINLLSSLSNEHRKAFWRGTQENVNMRKALTRAIQTSVTFDKEQVSSAVESALHSYLKATMEPGKSLPWVIGVNQNIYDHAVSSGIYTYSQSSTEHDVPQNEVEGE